ncbi:hypothetical protein MUA02_01105 [Enterobacteriaceae bacterium H20N1]|uniref:Uncharacterized protein n=1 Tax=Dryocola boscaweniae TaxID=2925397 RepID=A0A9X3AP32_9ENTR|nr:hypothetical protein [Dryocola boscaweniae]MCT4700505.1 hypothetical protein [Dryocola boscaweniae]MCT4717661.1 hypothetical protein [Dryocola boscaweniae]
MINTVSTNGSSLSGSWQMINALFEMPELMIEGNEKQYWNLRANGYCGRFYSACGGPALFSIMLPFVAKESISSLLCWNKQLAGGEGGGECALLYHTQQWWLAQQFMVIPADMAQSIRWQLKLADCMLLLNRQKLREGGRR